MSEQKELAAIVRAHAKTPVTKSTVPGLTLYCTDADQPISAHLVYEPMVCVMLQGEKRVDLGSRSFRYTPNQYLIASVDLPVTGTVTNARPGYPYLALSLALEQELIVELVSSDRRSAEQCNASGLGIGEMSEPLLDAFLRLARLLNEPDAIAQLAPLITREILFRLLNGTEAEMLRELVRRGGPMSSIARAIRSIRANFAESFSAEALADIAGMSVPSFNRHFRRVTMMSPLQYQKQIRLQEARRRLLRDDMSAATVAFDVGYSSASQFSREYLRTFGRAPRDHAKWLKHAEAYAILA